MSNILVAFFSVTGRTRKEADRIAAEKDADLIESCDFSGRKIVLFATSGGSGFGHTVDELRVSLPDDCLVEEGTVNGK